MHTCVGLELPSIIPHYRSLLNDCEGCDGGLNSLNIDEATIESQTLQMLEQVLSICSFLSHKISISIYIEIFRLNIIANCRNTVGFLYF